MHRYLVQCWIIPKSGKDLARKNRIVTLFREMLSAAFPNDMEIEKAVESFDRESDGRVLEPFVLDSDKEIKDGESELLPEVQKEYPEAELVLWQEIPISK